MEGAQKIRITKEFSFAMAHTLFGYDGLCANIHGHTYHLNITVLGHIMQQLGHPKNGMVIDFSEFKSIVQKHIVDIYDHSLVLNEAISHKEIERLGLLSQRVILAPYQPTCENLLLDFVGILKRELPAAVSLVTVMLRETPTSYAEWHQADNT